MTFEQRTPAGKRFVITANVAIAANELALGIDDDDQVFLPKVASALAPAGSWASELSSAEYATGGSIEKSTLLKIDVDVQTNGTLSWTATEDKVRSGVARPTNREMGLGVWQEVSPGHYLVKKSTTASNGEAFRLIGGALASESAIYIRQ